MRRHLPAALSAFSVFTIIVLFWWVYGRFAGQLYFVLDDTIETYAALSRSLGQAISDSFTGQINWSGYRPLSYAARAFMSHIFGLDKMIGYYLVSLGLHLINTLMLLALAHALLRSRAWAFVAAMFFLLLPAHNEAVLYMSANANLIALFFCLISLLASLAPPRRPGRGWWNALSALAYLAAILAYEVTLPLPLFVILADWRRKEPMRRRIALYFACGIAAMLALALRIWAGGGRITPGREDYAISLAPLHLLQGYAIFLGQMILLHTSAWIGLPLYSNLREWMSPLNPRAAVSVALTAVGAIVVLTLALRTPRPASPADDAAQRRVDPFWIGWGLLWLVAMSVLFAALVGRYPENRYTYIPSLGLSIAVGALTGWVYVALARRPVLAGAWLGLVVMILAGYTYVSTSDVSAWERASQHTRSLMHGALEALPTLPAGAGVALVGMPGVVGNVFTFNTEESFRAAMQMLYGGGVGKTWASDLALSDSLRQMPALGENAPGDNAVLLAYNRDTHTVHLADRAVLCTEIPDCRSFSFQSPATDAPPWVYLQTYRQENPQEGGLAMLFELPGDDSPRLASCWAFYDLKVAHIDPASFDNAALAVRCEKLADQVVATGVLTTSSFSAALVSVRKHVTY